MSTGFPTSLDTFTTKNNGDTLQAAHVNDIQDAVSALEAKVGVDGSSVATSHAKKIADITTILGSASAADLTKLHALTADAAELNKMDGVTGSTAEINAAVDAIKAATTQGDLLVKGASAIERLAAVAATQYLKSAGVSTKPAYSKLALRDTGVKVGTFSARSGDGFQAITGVGFTPSCVIAFANGAGYPAYFASWGFASLAASMCIWSMADFQKFYVSGFMLSSEHLVHVGPYGSAALSSMDTDGFTLSWTDRTNNDNPQGVLGVVYLALP